MECYNAYLLDKVNESIKHLGFKFRLEEEDNTFALLFFDGTKWEDYASGYYDEELPDLFIDAQGFAIRKGIQDNLF